MPFQRRFACSLTICILLMTALFVSLPAWAGDLDAPVKGQLEMALQQAVDDYDLAGAIALVRSPSGEKWWGVAGYADLATGEPMACYLRNGIGSVTKTFTSTVVLQLVQEGKLALYDTVETVLPGLLAVGDQVTVRQLLLMISGLNHYEQQPEFEAQMDADPLHEWSLEDLSRLCDGLAYTPGDHFDYNNGNYDILGLMIEARDGRTWQEAIQRRILDPLGMKGTGFMEGTLRPADPRALPHVFINGQAVDATRLASPSVGAASGAMYSTVADLLTWSDAFYGGRLLLPYMQELRMTDLVPIPGSGASFGMGWGRRSNGGTGFAGSFNDVYTSEWETYQGWSFCILSNGQSGPFINNGYHSASGVWASLMHALRLGGY